MSEGLYISSLNKLTDAQAYVNGQIAAIAASPGSPIDEKQVTQAFYDDLFSRLRAALAAYRVDVEDKAADLRAVIMGIFQARVLDTYVSEDIALISISGGHAGYSDIRELYNCDGVLDAIMAAPLPSFYGGKLSQMPPPIEELPPGQYLLNDLAIQASGAERAEHAQRLSLGRWLSRFNIMNSFALLFENCVGSTNYSSSDIANEIYITRHAKDVILEFGLPVYIPTYLRD